MHQKGVAEVQTDRKGLPDQRVRMLNIKGVGGIENWRQLNVSTIVGQCNRLWYVTACTYYIETLVILLGALATDSNRSNTGRQCG